MKGFVIFNSFTIKLQTISSFWKRYTELNIFWYNESDKLHSIASMKPILKYPQCNDKGCCTVIKDCTIFLL